jgi:hypothetical protein
MGVVGYGKVAVVGAIGVYAAVSYADRGMNYVETEAVVTAAAIDCFVKNGKRELVQKDTSKLAYMECDMATVAAPMHGFKESDIHKRTKLTFKYLSAADGSKQTGEHTKEYGSYKVGQKIKIYSHKSEPETMRWL